MDSIGMLLINGFIALMLLILWAWDLPERGLLNRLVFKLRLPIQRLGLAHTWCMFAPNPAQDNYRLQFKLSLADGSIVLLEPEYFRAPREQLQPVQYRWLKLKRSLLRPNATPLRASVCKYVAAAYLARLAVEAAPDKRPVEVQLIRLRQPIAPLAAKDTASPEPYKRGVIHTQTLGPATWTATAARAAEPAQPRLCPE
ncbi:MAG: hypothetical protein ABI977_36425 [Acidobacteriota bacterium]